MKKLEVNEMEMLEGGGFWGGVCAAFELAAASGVHLALTPVGSGIVLGGTAACVLWQAFS